MPDQPQRFVLGIAYQAGRDERIQKGADNRRDYFEKSELELAAWQFMAGPRDVGIFHADGTTGHAEVKESYIYRGPDWIIKNIAGEEVIVKDGDWLLGAVLDPVSWNMYERGLITGWSPQGGGRRRTPIIKEAETELAALDARRAELLQIIEGGE